ncbi:MULTISPECIES: crotonase/enoyl-CoA hydratase family protein [Rhodococcus]|uniref:Enoyl-CoA hydratase n=1 Tax=Rhodococcus opacus TaxID=37919 RepID=A0A076EIL7_RHOOP|nr:MULTISPECIES: crotonase/enoyl-CoA hydratase family protein [Rhodococcus]AII03324.1 enoyl-CoA hydratase [Rhodococcus opacus]WAM14651.1 crotonase/enoyl-CoA hydratase family protein [Rhodococcus sp. JS3073]
MIRTVDVEYETIALELRDGVLIVTLNRPESLNAFTITMADELEHLFRAVNDDDDVNAVVVTGSGRAFCAGMDLTTDGNVFGLDETLEPTLHDMGDLQDPVIARGVRDTGGRVTLAVFDCLKPVIAAVNGPAVGIGATLTLSMDARLASTAARFGFVFGRLGITPEAASTWFLTRIVGLDTALDLVYSADILDAADAAEIGLVRSVHSPDELLDAALALAHRFTRDRSRVATALTRQMMYRNALLDHPAEAHRIDSLAMFYTSIGDGKEGVQAFREKRKPQFNGRVSTDLPDFYTDWIER